MGKKYSGSEINAVKPEKKHTFKIEYNKILLF